MAAFDPAATLESLKTIAAAQVAKSRQRADRFTIYRLVRLKRDVKTPTGLAFARGEYAIGVDQDLAPNRVRCERFVTVWSRRDEIDTSVRATDVEWIDA